MKNDRYLWLALCAGFVLMAAAMFSTVMEDRGADASIVEVRP
jgi:hypothetical protein